MPGPSGNPIGVCDKFLVERLTTAQDEECKPEQ